MLLSDFDFARTFAKIFVILLTMRILSIPVRAVSKCFILHVIHVTPPHMDKKQKNYAYARHTHSEMSMCIISNANKTNFYVLKILKFKKLPQYIDMGPRSTKYDTFF
jgi:hypothetical protein